MSAVPCVAPGLTVPPDPVSVAIPAVPPLHVPFVELLVNVMFDPLAHIWVFPPVVAGVAFTVAVIVAALLQPLL